MHQIQKFVKRKNDAFVFALADEEKIPQPGRSKIFFVILMYITKALFRLYSTTVDFIDYQVSYYIEYYTGYVL